MRGRTGANTARNLREIGLALRAMRCARRMTFGFCWIQRLVAGTGPVSQWGTVGRFHRRRLNRLANANMTSTIPESPGTSRNVRTLKSRGGGHQHSLVGRAGWLPTLCGHGARGGVQELLATYQFVVRAVNWLRCTTPTRSVPRLRATSRKHTSNFAMPRATRGGPGRCCMKCGD